MINGVPLGKTEFGRGTSQPKPDIRSRTLAFAPRPLLQVDAYSGDRDAAGRTLGTYNPYFPRGAYFTPKAIPSLGPQNLTDLHPVLQFRARQNVTGEISWNWYWRESSYDGVYAFGSAALVDPSNGIRARYLGDQGDMEIRWAPAKHIVTAWNVADFAPPDFLLSSRTIDRPSSLTSDSPIAFKEKP